MRRVFPEHFSSVSFFFFFFSLFSLVFVLDDSRVNCSQTFVWKAVEGGFGGVIICVI